MTRLLSAPSTLTDGILLASMAEAINSRLEMTDLRTGIQALVAQVMLRRGEIQLGDAHLAIALSNVVTRNQNRFRVAPEGDIRYRSADVELPKNTFARLYKAIDVESLPSRKVDLGMALGDEALLTRAGFGSIETILSRIMNRDSYARGMAVSGYATALAHATTCKSTTADLAMQDLPRILVDFDRSTGILEEVRAA